MYCRLCVDWIERTDRKEVKWADRDRNLAANDEAIKFSGIPYMVLGSRVLECCCGLLRPRKNHYNVGVSHNCM